MSSKKSMNLWKYNKRSGYWDRQRDVSPDTKDAWLKIHQKDEPDEHFHVSTNKPKHNPTVKEDAPANAVGGGNIAGLGVGPQGEPGLKMKQRLKYKRKNQQDIQSREGEIATLVRRAQPVMEENHGVFAGNKTFIVPSDMFHKARVEKRKGKHWKTYIGEDEHGMAIREYANKNRKKAIILQDENTGAMCYARYGSK